MTNYLISIRYRYAVTASVKPPYYANKLGKKCSFFQACTRLVLVCALIRFPLVCVDSSPGVFNYRTLKEEPFNGWDSNVLDDR